jgi:isopentenyl diphosphate isomerase/L-lactate dehydrogenase-like FMN-dependent dehydrogenase
LSRERDLATTVMGQSISKPVINWPTGVQAVHPEGEVAVARAAAARGTAMGLSSIASKPVEEVVAANPQTFFQGVRVRLPRPDPRARERAKAAGAVALKRDWGSSAIPEQLDFKTVVRFAPEALAGGRRTSRCRTWPPR